MNYFLRIIFIFFLTISPKIVFGADIFFQSDSNSYRIGEQFILSVLISSEEENSINAVDLSIGFSQENLKFIQSFEKDSVLSLFVDKPNIINGKLNFSGISPGGFYGALDPLQVFDKSSLKAVKIIDFVFEPISSGRAEIYLDKGNLYRNDGSGLQVNFNSWPKILDIKNEFFSKIISFSDTVPPKEFIPQILRDKNIPNKYILIFNTIDEETGIEKYEVLEEGQKPIIAESPYILKNNPPKGKIFVKAFDKSGNIREVYIESQLFNKERDNFYPFIAIISLLVIFFLFVNKKRKKH